jgi:hypothetical protein
VPATNPSRRLPRLSPAESNVAGQAVALRCSVYGPIYPAPPPSPFQAHLFRVAHLRRFQEQRSGGRAALIDVRWHACAAALWFSSAPRNEMRATQVPLSALLLSAVHPVVLYTLTQPSTVPLQAESCVTSRVESGTTPSSTARCHVYDALYIRRCWCDSDAVHTQRYVAAGSLRGIGCQEEDKARAEGWKPLPAVVLMMRGGGRRWSVDAAW